MSDVKEFHLADRAVDWLAARISVAGTTRCRMRESLRDMTSALGHE